EHDARLLRRAGAKRRAPRGRRDRARRRIAARDPRDEDATEVPTAPARRVTMAKKTHGKTASGVPITDELVDKLAKEAEAGYDVDATLRRRVGRPPIGSAAANVESV